MSQETSLLTRAIARHRAGDADQAEALYRLTLASDPEEPNALAMLAAIERARGQHEAARDRLVRAAARAPDRPDIQESLGDVHRTLGNHDAAHTAYEKAIGAAPARAAGWLRRIDLLLSDGDTAAALRDLEQARAHCPHDPDLWDLDGATALNAGLDRRAERSFAHARKLAPERSDLMVKHGVALEELGQAERAVSAFEAAIASGADTPDVENELALACFVAGRLEQGWRHFEARWRARGEAPPPALSSRNWTGRMCPDLRLLVCAEQGVGDQIMFAAGIPPLARAIGPQGRLVIECAAKLVPLFARAWPDAAVQATQGETTGGLIRADYAWIAAHEPIDAVTHLGELPRHLLPVIDGAPYLAADRARAAHWQAWLATLGPGPKVGLCWRSSLSGSHRDRRFPPLQAWRDLFAALPGVQFVNLQYDDPDGHGWGQTAGETRIHVPPDLDQFDDLDGVAALMAGLDLVISTPTAVASLAGALGRPTLRVMHGSDWTLFGRQRTPFCASMDTIALARDARGATTMQPVITAARARLRA